MPMQMSDQVEAWSKDLRRLRHQKQRVRGGVEGSMLLDYLLYEGEHQSIQVQNAILTRAFRHEKDKNKLRLVVNLARRATDRKIGRHWSIAHRYRATPNTKDPKAFDFADLISDQLIPATDQKLQQGSLRWQIMSWVTPCGVAFEHVDWKEAVSQDVLPKYADEPGPDGQSELLWKDSLTGAEIPESQVQLLLQSGRVAPERFAPAVDVQEAGDIGGDVYDPFRVFVDASVPMVKKLGPDQRIYLLDIRTLEWVAETFGSDVAKRVQPSRDLSILSTQLLDRGVPVAGVNLKDLLPLVQGSQDKDDPEMCIVATMYQPPHKKHPQGLRAFFVPQQVELDVSEEPYPEVPIVDYHWSAPKSTMWTTGFIRDLQSLSKFINKRFSQLGEASNAQIYELLLLGEGLTARDIPTDFPGVVEDGLTDEGMPRVVNLPRGALPSFFPDSIRLSMETFESLASSDLLSQRKFPGQLRGPLAIPMLQEILDSEDGPRFDHFAEQFSWEKQMRINRIKQFYPPIRTLNYTGEDMRSEVLELHTDDILRAGIDFTVSVDPGSIMPEFSMMREARVRERFQWAPGLYTSKRTGTMDWSKLAEDLRHNDRQRESAESQGRKLARQLIQRARNGQFEVIQQPAQPVPPPQPSPAPQPSPDGQMPPAPSPQEPQNILQDVKTQQPFVVYPFWEHNAMMDEYEAVMQTTEFLDASPTFKRILLTLHDMHRQILTKIDQARQNSVDNKMVQSTIAQVAQQTAAKVASTATEAALEQVQEQQNQGGQGGGFAGMEDHIRQLMGDMQARGQMPGQPPPPAPMGAARRRMPV